MYKAKKSIFQQLISYIVKQSVLIVVYIILLNPLAGFLRPISLLKKNLIDH